MKKLLSVIVCTMISLFLSCMPANADGPRIAASAFADLAISASNADVFNAQNLYKDYELVGTVVMKDRDRFVLYLNQTDICYYSVVVVMSNLNTSNISVGQIVTVDSVYRGHLIEPASPLFPKPCVNFMFEGIRLIQ